MVTVVPAGVIKRSCVTGAVLATIAVSAIPVARPAVAAITRAMMPTFGVNATAPRTIGLAVPLAPMILVPGSIPVRADTASALADVFDRHDYRIARVRHYGTVPRLFLDRLPQDLDKIGSVAARKALYKRSVLPLVLAVNETIMANRARIERLRDRLAERQGLTLEERRWIAGMFDRHGVSLFDFAELLRRVDVVVPSLAIAQSAEESGWGTSRFAREANALFGQRIYKDGLGLVPRRREPGKRFRVRAFYRLLDAVQAYANNLNSHPAYAGFRAARAELRRRNRVFDGLVLAPQLRRYSERRDAYVATIKRIIRIDRLTDFDGARLGEAAADLVLDSAD